MPAHVSANVLNQPDGLSICVVATDLTELENSDRDDPAASPPAGSPAGRQ